MQDCDVVLSSRESCAVNESASQSIRRASPRAQDGNVENSLKSTLCGIKPSLKLFRLDYMKENTIESAQDN